MLPRRFFSDIIPFMDTKQKSTYSKEARRKKNKRFNTILYIIAGLLVVAGIVIILSDTTYIFNGIIDPDNYGVDIPLPTGSFTIVTPRPDDSTPGPDDTSAPGSPDAPHFTLPPGATLPPETPTPQPTATPKPTATPAPQNPNRPVSVYFHGYSINCPVDPVGYDYNGVMKTVRAHNRAAWLRYSGDPVSGGNIIIAGHNKYSGKLGYFNIIKTDLKVGDIVSVETAAGERYYYQVESINYYYYTEVPYTVMDMSPGTHDRLTLITCQGDFNSNLGTSMHRVVAVCVPITFE